MFVFENLNTWKFSSNMTRSLITHALCVDTHHEV